ncbi:MAG: urease accessory protein UreF [Gammaproteobacteria bacterium]
MTSIVSHSANVDPSMLLRLLQLASPSLPVGAYSYSEGLEYAVHAGWVRDAQSLQTWLRDGLLDGAAQLEAAIVARVHDAYVGGETNGSERWDDWLSAARETEELRAQSHDMGRALLRLLADLSPPLPVARAWLARSCNFATAFAMAGAQWGIAREATVVAYLQSWVANLASAGVKLIPLGQTAGQQLLLELQPTVLQAVSLALAASDDDLGVANCGLALASMAHETQYSRLFRS